MEVLYMLMEVLMEVLYILPAVRFLLLRPTIQKRYRTSIIQASKCVD